jgi:holo-[acyl-carrier protein] synthase
MIWGIGTDLIEIARFADIDLQRIKQRLFTTREQEWIPTQPQRCLEYIAGRFAAKEAIAKALRTGIGESLRFFDMEIFVDQRGAPYVELAESVRQRLFGEAQVKIHLSISHSQSYATAVAVVEVESNA